MGEVPYTVETLQDFVVLGDGRGLTLGGLQVGGGDDAGRSIELYDSDRRLLRAWTQRYPDAYGVFDPRNPRRLPVWSDTEAPGLQLVEITGDGYPSS